MHEEIKPLISLLVLNWNGYQDTIRCLESLLGSTYKNYEIFIIDNGSTDKSISKISNYCKAHQIDTLLTDLDTINSEVFFQEKKVFFHKEGRRICILDNKNNLGFAGGYNVYINYQLQRQDVDYFILLNNDTIVADDFLEQMILEGERKHSHITGAALLSPRTDTINNIGGKLNPFTGYVHRFHAGKAYDTIDKRTIKVSFVEGSAFMVKSSAAQKVGLLKEEFFTYWEDMDYCIRAQRKKLRIYSVPRARVWHEVSKSDQSGRKIYFLARNGIWLIKGHFTLLHLLVYMCVQILKTPYLFLFKFKLNRKKVAKFLQGTYDGLFTDN